MQTCPRLILILSLILLLAISTMRTGPSFLAHAAGVGQPATFFLHKQTSKTINTVSSTLWSNTSKSWSPSQQTENRTVTSGSPGIWNFYTEPALAGPASLGGATNFTIYLSALPNTGGGTTIMGNLTEITQTGTTIPIGSATTSGNIATRPTPFYLTANVSPLQLQEGSIIDFTFSVTFKTGISIIALFYDTAISQSQVLLTFQSRVGVSTFQTFNETGATTEFFSRNSTATARQVSFLAVPFDALGIYDLATLELNLSSPLNFQIMTNAGLTHTDGAALDYNGTWELNYTYSNNDPSGTYSSSLGLTDNSGFSITAQLSYVLVAWWQLNIQTLSQGPSSTPIGGVAAIVSADMGAVPVYFGISNASGWMVPQEPALPDNTTYTVSPYWEGVALSPIGPLRLAMSQGLSLRVSAFQLDFNSVFRDGDGNPLSRPPSSFQLLCPNGSLTHPDPAGTYLLPAGPYVVSQVIWDGTDVTPAVAGFNLGSGTPGINLEVYRLTVMAVDQDGKAVSGAKVTVSRSAEVVQEGLTGSQGSVTFTGLTRAEYTSVVYAGQSQPAAAKIDLTGSSTLSVKVSLSAPLSASSGIGLLILWGGLVLVAALAGLVYFRVLRRRSSGHPHKQPGTEAQDSGARALGTKHSYMPHRA